MFEVGQRVWDVVRGRGVVVDVREYVCTYPVIVRLDFGRFESYTTDGRHSEHNENISIYPYPVEVVKKSVRQATKPSINWEQVREEYKFLARDENNTAWLYQEEPVIYREGWGVTRGMPAEAGSYVSYTPGTCNWKDSLVERPEGA